MIISRKYDYDLSPSLYFFCLYPFSIHVLILWIKNIHFLLSELKIVVYYKCEYAYEFTVYYWLNELTTVDKTPAESWAHNISLIISFFKDLMTPQPTCIAEIANDIELKLYNTK